MNDSRYGTTTAWSCIKSIYQEAGFLGFYKGITASYFGISETIIHFVIYEFIKNKLKEKRIRDQAALGQSGSKEKYHFFQFMAAGAVSKTIASILAYPHGELNAYNVLTCLVTNNENEFVSNRGCSNSTSPGGKQVSKILPNSNPCLARRGEKRSVSRVRNSVGSTDS